jgi:peroxiredoxin (alkyl hydroperoxide reductase subunit C)
MTADAASPVIQGALARIDEQAPTFEARSTQGLIRLTDYRGRWLLFFSHPADFTPVCTSEFLALQQALPRFEAMGCALLGLSVDSLYAHLAWLADMESRFGVRITFPIIEDISMQVARVYGMIHDASASTAAVRSVFFIDPEGYVRALVHYPMSIGRSVDELLRVLAALQTADEASVATPEGWQPGEATMLPPPVDQAEAEARTGQAWYYTMSGDAS